MFGRGAGGLSGARRYHLAVLVLTFCLGAGLCRAMSVESATTRQPVRQGRWWMTAPEEEKPSSFYPSIPYSEIGPRLRDIEQSSPRVQVQVVGRSAGGRNLYLAVIADPEAHGKFGRYQMLRRLMIRDPARAQQQIEGFADFKVPVLIVGSIHGNEYPGSDAAMRLVETLAFGREGVPEEDIRAVLDNCIVLVDVVQNPDGRVAGRRENDDGFDLNRDFMTQSQPETRALARLLAEWNPMVMLDLHGFVSPMLIEPTTAPHNPNYEYDLYLKWAFRQAKAMEKELSSRLGLPAEIPFRDFPDGWDDWAPIFAPQYAMFHGAYAHTLETSREDEVGVDAHFWSIWGALRFAARNRPQMVHDQIEIFRRGFLALNQQLIPPELLSESPFEQFNELTTIEFPSAYIIPSAPPRQRNPHAARRLIDFLLDNDIEVRQATREFWHEDVLYGKGTYLVDMSQPKRGLANTILWDGRDVSQSPGLTLFDIAGWDHPRLWGVDRSIAMADPSVASVPVHEADRLPGSVVGEGGSVFAFEPTSNEAIEAANELLERDVPLHRTPRGVLNSGRRLIPGTFILSGMGRAGQAIASRLAAEKGLQVMSLDGVPDGAVRLRRQRLAVSVGENTDYVLRQLGFQVDKVTRNDLNAGGLDPGVYDVFINGGIPWRGLNAQGRSSVTSFFAAGGDYIGFGPLGVSFAVDAGLVAVGIASGDPFASGVIVVDYAEDDPISAGYPISSHAFVTSPLWFDGVPGGFDVTARIGEGAFFLSGFWRGWPLSGAAGKPIIVHTSTGASQVTLMGLEPTFRAHPRHTFRLLANAIFTSLD